MKTTRPNGFTRISALVTLVGVLILAGYGIAWMRHQMRLKKCEQQLRQIYSALELYEMDYGVLPHIAFYPDDPHYAPESMLVVLDPYGVTMDIGILPCSHPVIIEHGLSLVWNVKMNGRKLQSEGEPTWLITELSALSGDLPRSSFHRYLTLYSNGETRRSRLPPKGLTELLTTTPIR